jgi:hypothetical protein
MNAVKNRPVKPAQGQLARGVLYESFFMHTLGFFLGVLR